MKKLLELRGTIIKDFTIELPEFEERVLKATRQCCRILDFNSQCNIYYKTGDTTSVRKSVYANLYWRLFFPFKFRQVIVLTEDALETNYDTLGIILLHRLIHVKQGFWKTAIENISNKIKRVPPYEIEATQFLIDLWWGQKQMEVK